MHTQALAKWLFDRQAATYDADPALIELAWLDPDINTFWTEEAEAILAYLEHSHAG